MNNNETLSPREARRVSDMNDLDRRRVLVAYLRAQGRSHDEIAALLGSLPSPIGVRGPVIVNDLARAGLDKWIVTRFQRELFKEPLVREIDDLVHHQPWLALERSLQRLSDGVLSRLFVVFSDADADPEAKDWPRILDRFASNAAPLLADMLLEARLVGVCWGGTIGNVLQAMIGLKLDIDRDKRKRVPVVPTAGQPQGTEFRTSGWDSTTLARQLSIFLNGTDAYLPSLDNVRPIVPPKFIDSPEVLEALLDDSSHADIFGTGPADNKALLNRADAILASCGCFHNPKTVLWEWVGKHSVDVKAVAMGDIGGALIPRPGVSEGDFLKVARLWTGIRLEHFKATARRSPGVILCAAGAAKAEITLELIRRSLVSTLVIDERLAQALAAAQGC